MQVKKKNTNQTIQKNHRNKNQKQKLQTIQKIVNLKMLQNQIKKQFYPHQHQVMYLHRKI